MIYVIGAIIYLAFALMTAGTFVADLQSIGSKQLADKHYRQNLAICIGIGLLPVIPWFVAPFLSGFWEHGWTLKRRKN